MTAVKARCDRDHTPLITSGCHRRLVLLMALVPLLAIALSMLKGLGAGRGFEEKIEAALKDMPEQFVAFANDILTHMGANIVHCGGVGTGQAAKICNNMLLVR